MFPTPAPDFSDPLGLLAACHRRMAAQCALLECVLHRLPEQGADDEVGAAAARVRRYFEQAAPQHHADEEQDLFPLLASTPGLGRLIADLQREHAHLDAAWRALAPALTRLEGGEVARGLHAAVEIFVTAYRAHVAREDAGILPAARERLGADQLRVLGRRMAQRRGVGGPASG